MLPFDNAVSAALAARGIKDRRVRHFHDPHKRAGRALAAGLGSRDKVAWDMYLFYDKNSQWTEPFPAPTRWVHQLSADWADRDRYRTGDALIEALTAAMRELTG